MTIFTGCSSSDTQKNNFDLNVNQSNNTEKIMIKEDLLIEKICNNELYYIDGYGDGEVLKCGKYYKKIPDIDLADAPEVIFDKNGFQVAFCGGMPGPDGYEETPKECLIQCSKVNLC